MGFDVPLLLVFLLYSIYSQVAKTLFTPGIKMLPGGLDHKGTAPSKDGIVLKHISDTWPHHTWNVNTNA